MSEQWCPFPGDGRYSVSSLGRIRGVKGHVLSTPPNRAGYLRVTVMRKRTFVHHVVAFTFLGPRPQRKVIRHLDGNKLNNAASNLAYGTWAENAADHARHVGHPNALKTHCKQGHEFTPENIYRTPCRPNSRTCRICVRLAQRRYAARQAQT